MRSARKLHAIAFLICALAAISCSRDEPRITDPGDDPPSQPSPPSPPPNPSEPGSIAPDFSLSLDVVASGLVDPIALASLPGDEALIVAEKRGRIVVIRNGEMMPEPFLDIQLLVRNGGEQGLLGLAFHPNYQINGWFYVFYIGWDSQSHIVRYTRSAADVYSANPASGVGVMTIPPHETNHNGGNIVFAPDGKLLIGLGDGGIPYTVAGPLGKLLRINVDQVPYSIPVDNPYIGHPSIAPEAWAIGLRNPWRFSIDRSRGVLYIADVGDHSAEEVNAVPLSRAGVDYGWSTMEGRGCFQSISCEQEGLVLPVFDYGRSDGCSVIGGFVYRGRAIPEIVGRYFYSDFCFGWLRSMRYLDGVATEHREWDVAISGPVLSFGEDANGEIYLLTRAGRVYRIARGLNQ